MSVLSHDDIDSRYNLIFKSGADRRNIRAAKYVLTLGEDFLVLPDGKQCRPSPASPRTQPFIINPGESAIVSTKERIVMPANLVGILGSRFESAEQGVLFFGGMVVDPGYGLSTEDRDMANAKGQPLTFTIGNVGNKPIELRPGVDAVASIVFHTLTQAIRENDLLDRDKYLITQPAKNRSEYMGNKKKKLRKLPAPLGFVQELSEVRKEVDRARASTEQVVLFGVIVLAVALCASLVGAMLVVSAETESKLEIEGSLATTLGIVGGAIVLVIAFFYVALKLFAHWYHINRKVRLNRIGD